MIRTPNGDVLECSRDLIDVTSLRRPDTGWRFVDAAGHEHRWHDVDGEPAESYDPSMQYHAPTLAWVKDGEEYWEDDDRPHNVGHHECARCGERIEPRYRADDTAQYIAGLLRCTINGRPVSEEEFKAAIDKLKQEKS